MNVNRRTFLPGQFNNHAESVTALCLSCTKPTCPGDCADRKAAAGAIRARRQDARAALDTSRLTARETEFLSLYDKGMGDKECAECMGMSSSGVRHIRVRLGLAALYPQGKRRGVAFA